MHNLIFIVSIIIGYIALQFIIAYFVERNQALREKVSKSPWVYALSLGVYCTAWTYYGSVGKAASSGMLFLTIYLGPTIMILFWWIALRKMVRIKNTYHVTSIADFISARYNKSGALAVIATLVAIIGIVPYIGLQIKAIFSSMEVITRFTDIQSTALAHYFVLGVMIAFTILLGVRKLDPTERHPGMLAALSVECIVKLLAFLAVGIFVTFFMFHGFEDIFKRIPEQPFSSLLTSSDTPTIPYVTWMSYLVLAMSAIMFLPRQFHVAVIENSDERHIKAAMWFFPLYMLLLNIFVYPIAMGGLLVGYSAKDADTFVLLLPHAQGAHWLGLFAFLGGLSAALGMIMVASVTLSTMAVNHLLLPLLGKGTAFGFLKRYLLQCRWVAVALIILCGFWFAQAVGASYTLVNIGMISFAAVLQFAPAILGGIFWRKANKKGALLGLSVGFLVWFYTILIPSFIRSGWLPQSVLVQGPWGLDFLNPEQLFGIDRLDPLSHGVFWSMLCNIGLFVLGSMCLKQEEEEKAIADSCVDILSRSAGVPDKTIRSISINLEDKKRILENLLRQYFTAQDAVLFLDKCVVDAKIADKGSISIMELSELSSVVERYLAGSVGVREAHKALKQSVLFSSDEGRQLKDEYAQIIMALQLSPEDLKSRIDYYKDREALVTRYSQELESKIKELEENILQRRRAEEALKIIQNELERRVEERTVDIVRANEALRLEISERKRAEEELENNYKAQNVLTKILSLSLTEVSIDELAKQALNFILSIDWLSLEAKGAIFLVGNSPDQLIMKASHNLPETLGRECALIPFGKCLCGKAAMTKQVQYASCIDENHEIRYEGMSPHGHYCVPVVFLDKVLGVINLYVKEHHTYNAKEEEFIHTIAYVLAGIIMRKHAEEALQIEKVKAQTYFEIAGVMMIVINRDQTVGLINNKGCKLLGYGWQDIVGKNWFDSFIPGEEREAVRSFFVENMAKGMIADYHENLILAKTGESRLIGWHNTLLKDEEGNAFCALSSGEDITERTRAEKELKSAYEKLKQTQSQLLHSSKMAAVGQLASGVAHEINNPLTGVLNNVQLIKMEMEETSEMKPDEFKDVLAVIEESALRCKNIVRSLLDFSRSSMGVSEPISFNEVIKKVVTLIGYEMKLQNVTIELTLAPDLPQVMGDLQLIQQVIFNLLSNAKWAIDKKSGKTGGVITITTRFEKKENFVYIVICDTGTGIPQEDLERIFEPFFTTKPVGEGTGLGLSFVYKIIKDHNGTIAVESMQGQGTTFRIGLPSLQRLQQ